MPDDISLTQLARTVAALDDRLTDIDRNSTGCRIASPSRRRPAVGVHGSAAAGFLYGRALTGALLFGALNFGAAFALAYYALSGCAPGSARPC